MGKLYRRIKEQLAQTYDEGESQTMAMMLLEGVANLSRTDVLMDRDDLLNPDEIAIFDSFLMRLKRNEPIQYVLGKAEFCGMTLSVDKNVLIPRPETEELVRVACLHEGKESGKILDIGTGSGCIALALKRKYPKAEVEGWDISEDALRVARKNADEIGENVSFSCVDILKCEDENGNSVRTSGNEFDLIVSNPPYICNDEIEEMEKNVVDFEPHGALFVPNEKPLLFYEAISRFARKALKTGGMLCFEINRKYGNETAELMKKEGFHDVSIETDQFGNERIVKGWK